MPSAIPPFLYSLIIINYQLFDCEDFHVLSKQRIIVKLILHQFNRDQMISLSEQHCYISAPPQQQAQPCVVTLWKLSVIA